MNKFIDSNIIIYAYSEDEPGKQTAAFKLLKDKNLFLSTQTINEFIWIMLRKFKVEANIIFEIVNNILNVYNIVIVGKNSILKALNLCSKYKCSYWDSLIISSALEHDCRIIYSEDMQHGQIIENTATIINPFTK